ncbi:hypothetical protein N6B72_05550 [Chryseobacterium soli]|uniref:hypothetical protein n=1 Tax=Chryseobacterium soli TaxID=445961 RepID=UPI0029548F66|nr:hypothetical protein [Chryseobacterium soli]MDV7696381.1 hypothetical protein [Chryseobacterium soli]
MKNQSTTSNPSLLLKNLSVVFFGLLLGMIMMGGIVYSMNPSENFEADLHNPFLAVMIIVSVAGVFGSNRLYAFFINKIKEDDPLGDKTAKIQQAIIVRLALVEGPALVGIVLYLKEANLVFLMFSAFLILYFLTLKPSKDKLLEDMKLTGTEKREFQNS